MRWLVPGVIVILGVLALGSATRVSGSHAAQSEETGVSIADYAYDPADVHIARDGRVTWTNHQHVKHTVTSVDGLFDSGVLLPGDTFSLEGLSLEPGSYTYQCGIHGLRMTGTVIVDE